MRLDPAINGALKVISEEVIKPEAADGPSPAMLNALLLVVGSGVHALVSIADSLEKIADDLHLSRKLG